MHGREMPEQDESGKTLLLGALLDGVPETAVLGSTLIAGSGIGVPVLAAIFLSNLPEGIGGASDMRTSGVSRGRIFMLWSGVTLICAASSAIGYQVLARCGRTKPSRSSRHLRPAASWQCSRSRCSPTPTPGEAAERGSMTVFGFALAYLLSTIG